MSQKVTEKKSTTDATNRRLGQPVALENGCPPNLSSYTLYVLSALIFGGLIWAGTATISEVAVANGEIVPAGQIRPVQHLEGGIVDQVIVRENDLIKAGDPIIKLKSELTASELNRIETRLAWLKMEDARLSAELSGGEPNFSAFETKYAQLIERQMASFLAVVQDERSMQQSFKQAISLTEAEVVAVESEVTQLAVQTATLRQIFEMQTDLMQKSVSSRRIFLESKAAYQSTLTDLASARVRLARAKKNLGEATNKYDNTVTKLRREKSTQRAKIAQEILELTHQLTKHQDQRKRLIVRAPLDGIVKNVVPTSVGSVIHPRQIIAEIVPSDQTFVAEVKVRPRDIGHVSAGNDVELTVTAYDFNIHGKIPGVVQGISASSYKDETGEPYFKARVALPRSQSAEHMAQPRLIPGMVVNAKIVTGSKSILRYLLKPIYKSVDRAFSER